MLVSWNWLKDYVPLDMTVEELEHRLSMTGLNHEETKQVGDDGCIDLEVTSNRPDCLGHIGVAREIGVVFDLPLGVPDPQPKAIGAKATDLASVDIECLDLCSRYTARVIRGVKIGPSPDWLTQRLTTLDIAVINNVVDISNYVLMECGQPLHTFDYGKLAESTIIVRRAAKDEGFQAIDHKTYTLDESMCVIADAQGPVALGGVMGGAATEVGDDTTDILIETAEFNPLSIRKTARRLKLHSPSSYRFERGVDSEGVDWASRRCCELILDLAGGELAEGVIDVGEKRQRPGPIVLRLSQLSRILGIEIPAAEVERILLALGNEKRDGGDTHFEVQPPSWRADLTREIDLVEEVGRIHGYDKIPEDAGVRMAASYRRDSDRRDEKVRQMLIAAGFDEALTATAVSQQWNAAFSPWSDSPPLLTSTAMLRGADRVRRSLAPSLLAARQTNQSLGNDVVELFEIAKVYLTRSGDLPIERWMLALTSGQDFYSVKGIIESLAQSLNPEVVLHTETTQQPLLSPAASCQLVLGKEVCAVVGELTPAGLKEFGLRSPTTIAEVRLELLGDVAELVPQYRELVRYPAIEQDLNFVVAEKVRWAELAAAVQSGAGSVLEAVQYRETYRDPDNDGADTKRLLLSMRLRSPEGTLTGEQAESIRASVIAECEQQVGAKLLA